MNITEFGRNLFISLLAELFVAIITLLIKEKRLRIAVLFIGTVIAGIIGFGPQLITRLSPPKSTPTHPTPMPTNTLSPQPSSTFSTLYDDFTGSEFTGKWNKSLWNYFSPDGQTSIGQRDGYMVISRQKLGTGGLYASNFIETSEIRYIEAKLNLDINTMEGGIGIGINDDGWFVGCVIYRGGNSAFARGDTSLGYATTSTEVGFNTWHIMRLEISPDGKAVTFFLDDKSIGRYDSFNHTKFSIMISVFSGDGNLATGYIDDVKIWK